MRRGAGVARARSWPRCRRGGCRFCGDGGNRARRFAVRTGASAARERGRGSLDDCRGCCRLRWMEATAAAGAFAAAFSSRAAGAAGGFTTTPAGGGATTTTGRAAATAPAGALATTAPAGGRHAMAGGAGGGATIGGAERGCGTILRGSGRAGAGAAGFAATGAAAARAQLAPQAWLAELPPASPANARGVPPLPLPSSWPEWPSSHLRAWRCARDRSWGRWLRRRGARAPRPDAGQAALPAQSAHEPSPPRPAPASWSVSCLQQRRVPEECRESRET